MKRTDMLRKERELKRARKKEERLEKGEKEEKSIGDYINELYDLFFFDKTRIYNAKESVEILELFEEMNEELNQEQVDTVLRKAIRKTKVQAKEQAFSEIKNLIEG